MKLAYNVKRQPITRRTLLSGAAVGSLVAAGTTLFGQETAAAAGQGATCVAGYGPERARRRIRPERLRTEPTADHRSVDH